MIRSTQNIKLALSLGLHFGGTLTVLGAFFLLISHHRRGEKMLRDGAWRHLTPVDTGWVVAKPFFFTGVGVLLVWAIAELLTKV